MPTVRSNRTADLVLSQSKVLHMDKTIALLEPDAAPLTTITMKAATKPVDNSTFYHREQEIMPRRIVFTEADAADQTDPVVSSTHGGYLVAEDCIFIPRTKEIMLCTAESSGTLTVVRGTGGTTAKAIVAGDEGYILPSAFEEDDTAPNARMALEVLKTFYTQIMRDTCQISKTIAATRMYHGSDRIWQQKVKMIEHKVKLEMLLMFGGTGASTSGSSTYYRQSAGLTGWIQSNQFDVGGQLTRPEFYRILRKAAQYHRGKWLLVCSPLIASIINGWAIGDLQISPNAKEWGVDVQRVYTPHNAVDIVQQPLFTGNNLDGWAILLPQPIANFVKFRPLSHGGENRNTRLMTNIKTDDDPDYYKDQIKTEAGFEFYEEKKMALITGVAG